MKTNAYVVFEVMEYGHQIRGIFPDTVEGVEDAMEWGDENFDDFNVVEPPELDVGVAYMQKIHGIYMPGKDEDE